MKKIIVKDLKPFCKYNNKEIGIAYSYFAGEKFKELSGDEYITDVTGESFGWIDSQGIVYVDSKHKMTRPSEEEVISALNKYPNLLKHALNLSYIKLTVDYQRPNPMDYPDTPEGDFDYMYDYWQGDWEAMAYHDDIGDR